MFGQGVHVMVLGVRWGLWVAEGVGGVADRLFVDLAADGRVSVSTWLDGELPGGAAGTPYPLAWPLDPDALEDLRWYLEDYLRAPFGVYEDRGPGIAARLPGWGEAVFEAVFGAGPPRDAYQRMRARAAGVQVVVRSSSAPLLGLPWELMRDPRRELPLALDAGMAGIDRSLPAGELGASFEVAGDRLGQGALPGRGIRPSLQVLERATRLVRSIKDLIHHLCSRGDDRAKLAPVHRFRDAR